MYTRSKLHRKSDLFSRKMTPFIGCHFIIKRPQHEDHQINRGNFDEYFPSLLNEKKNIRAFLPTFRAEKEMCVLFGTDIFFYSYPY